MPNFLVSRLLWFLFFLWNLIWNRFRICWCFSRDAHVDCSTVYISRRTNTNSSFRIWWCLFAITLLNWRTLTLLVFFIKIWQIGWALWAGFIIAVIIWLTWRTKCWCSCCLFLFFNTFSRFIIINFILLAANRPWWTLPFKRIPLLAIWTLWARLRLRVPNRFRWWACTSWICVCLFARNHCLCGILNTPSSYMIKMFIFTTFLDTYAIYFSISLSRRTCLTFVRILIISRLF